MFFNIDKCEVYNHKMHILKRMIIVNHSNKVPYIHIAVIGFATACFHALLFSNLNRKKGTGRSIGMPLFFQTVSVYYVNVRNDIFN